MFPDLLQEFTKIPYRFNFLCLLSYKRNNKIQKKLPKTSKRILGNIIINSLIIDLKSLLIYNLKKYAIIFENLIFAINMKIFVSLHDYIIHITFITLR